MNKKEIEQFCTVAERDRLRAVNKQLVEALRVTRKMLYERADMTTAKAAVEVGQQCEQVDALLRELGEDA